MSYLLLMREKQSPINEIGIDADAYPERGQIREWEWMYYLITFVYTSWHHLIIQSYCMRVVQNNFMELK